MINKKASIFFVFLLFGLFCFPLPADSTASLTFKLEPNTIMIETFFNGASISVSGKVAADNEVLIVLKGRSEDLTLKKKGKALGVLWMNLGEVTFHQVPSLYLLSSSKNLDELTHADRKQWEQLGIGFESLGRTIEITAPSAEGQKDLLFQEFIKLKQSQGLYAVDPKAAQFKNIDGKWKSYQAHVRVPPRIAPGEYELTVMEIHDGAVIATAVESLKVQEAGLPAMLSNLAFNHGALYGFLAVLIAIGAGLLMDFFFGQSEGAH